MAIRKWIRVMKRKNLYPVVGNRQPSPVFFTDEQKERMWQTEGCYRPWGERNGKTAEADGH